MITVREHTRRSPETKPDPFATVMEARRERFIRKWMPHAPKADNDSVAPRSAALNTPLAKGILNLFRWRR